MNKKVMAIIAELIPIISAPLSYLLIISPYDAKPIRWIILITVIFSFFGFIFLFIGRALDKESKTVKILGILDCFSTLFIIALYIIAIFCFGL